MFPNLRAEMARKGITYRDLHNRLIDRGYKISLSTLSQKLNGKAIMTMPDAYAIRDAIDCDFSLDDLYKTEMPE